MKYHSDQKVGLIFLLLPLLLAVLACTSQSLTPTLISGTQAGTQSPAQTTPAQQTTITFLTAAPTKGLAATLTTSLVGEVGDRILSGGVIITAISITKTAQIGLFTAGQGNIYLDVEVMIDNASRGDKIPYNPFYFKVKDADGNTYPAALTSLEPSLKTGDLDKGEKVRGHIAFEVNARVNPLILSFEPNVYLKDYQVIRFNLSQQSAHPVAVPTFQPPVLMGRWANGWYRTGSH